MQQTLETILPPDTRAGTPSAGSPLARRLAATLVAVVAAVLGVYMVVSYLQRRSLLEDGLHQQVGVLASALRVPTEQLLADGRVHELNELLRLALQAESVYAAAVLAADRTPVAGEATDLPCLLQYLPVRFSPRLEYGAADCAAGVRWSVVPLETEGRWLLVGVEDHLLDRSVTAAVQRQLALLVVLALLLSLAIVMILQRLVSAPLNVIMQHVRVLAGHGAPPALRLDAPAGELEQLAAVLNEATGELRAREAALLRQADEKIQLERRLAQAEKFAVIGRLSGGLAHELGSPLSVIGMRATALHRHAGGNAQIEEQAGVITAEVARMTSFIQGLLHLSGSHGVVFSRLDARDVVERVRHDLTRHARNANVEVTVSLPREPVWIRGQESMLTHALRNGLRNAIQALSLQTGTRRLDLRVEAGNSDVALVVEDTGPGIAPGDVDKVFEPFHTTKSVGEGLGLGLSITRGIVEEHGGEVAIQNRAEGGVRFTIRLPRDEEREDDEQRA